MDPDAARTIYGRTGTITCLKCGLLGKLQILAQLSAPEFAGYDAGEHTHISPARTDERSGRFNMVRTAVKSSIKRWLAVLMIAALTFATTSYLSHVDVKAHESSSAPHCEICLAWAGGALSRPDTDLVPAFMSLSTDVPAALFADIWVPRRISAHRSRAPPQHL